ncbi:MAG: nucleotidyl transferase AbiEii/AbiGii toxin family protein [Candidatus Paceibacterota bacterium]
MKQEALTSEAKKVLPQLDTFSDFYLAGGTGLALQLGHRVSVDLDLFTQKKFPSNLLSRVEKQFSESKVEVKIKQSEQLMVEIDDVEVTSTHDLHGGKGFEPIGSYDNRFNGSFDGGDYKIFDLYINRPNQSQVGLFSTLASSSYVANVHLKNVDITGNSNTGALAGYSYASTTNCTFTGEVNDGSGGLIGRLYLK